MKLFDSHAHYDDEAYDGDRAELLAAIRAAGVSHIVNCASSWASVATTLQLTREHPFIYSALGIHPSNGLDYTDAVEEQLRTLLQDDRAVAVGEIGLDYYWEDNPSREWQQQILLRQFDLAREAGKPVILHVREAYGDMMDILRGNRDLRAVLHSFSGSPEIAGEAVAMGFHLGIGGVATFKNAKKLPDVIRETPIEFLLTETDAPYLTPVPFRGKRNRSDYITYVVAAIARFKEMDPEEAAEILHQNSLRFFGLEDHVAKSQLPDRL